MKQWEHLTLKYYDGAWHKDGQPVGDPGVEGWELISAVSSMEQTQRSPYTVGGVSVQAPIITMHVVFGFFKREVR